MSLRMGIWFTRSSEKLEGGVGHHHVFSWATLGPLSLFPLLLFSPLLLFPLPLHRCPVTVTVAAGAGSCEGGGGLLGLLAAPVAPNTRGVPALSPVPADARDAPPLLPLHEAPDWAGQRGQQPLTWLCAGEEGPRCALGVRGEVSVWRMAYWVEAEAWGAARGSRERAWGAGERCEEDEEDCCCWCCAREEGKRGSVSTPWLRGAPFPGEMGVCLECGIAMGCVWSPGTGIRQSGNVFGAKG